MSVRRSAALALALVADASAAGSWMAAVDLPDLGMVAAAEAGIVLERLALVPEVGTKAWPMVVAALLDAVDVVLVRPPVGLAAGLARRLVARARERGAVLVLLGRAWAEPVDVGLDVVASRWCGLEQGHGRLVARQVEVVVGGRGAASRERRAWLWLPSPAAAHGGPYVERLGPERLGGGRRSRPRFGRGGGLPSGLSELDRDVAPSATVLGMPG